MAMKVDEAIHAGTQVKEAERYFNTQLPGYVEACTLAYDTVQPPIMEAMGKQPLPYLLSGIFGAGFVMGSLFAQGKGAQAMAWLDKQRGQDGR